MQAQSIVQAVNPDSPAVDYLQNERAVPIEWLRRPTELVPGDRIRVVIERRTAKRACLRRPIQRWNISRLIAGDESGREWVAFERPHSTLEPAGGIGKFVSLVREEAADLGLSTIDLTTGEPVHLDRLLGA